MSTQGLARAAIGGGLLASLAGNAMAAQPTVLGRTVAAFAPFALALAVALLEHADPPAGHWRTATWLATGILAAVAAWVSYWHLVELASGAGEHGPATRYLLPLAPDALVLIGSAYLRRPEPLAEPVTVAEALAIVAPRPEPTPEPAPVPGPPEPAPEPPARPDKPLPAPSPTRRAGADTVTKADRVRLLAAEHPDWTQAQLAEAAGCDVRTVRRALAQPATPEPAPTAIHPDQFIDQLTTGAQP